MIPGELPKVSKLQNLRNTFAAALSEAERAFSTMNNIKTLLQSCLSDSRTEHLTFLHHNLCMMNNLTHEEILSEFQNKKTRRVALWFLKTISQGELASKQAKKGAGIIISKSGCTRPILNRWTRIRP